MDGSGHCGHTHAIWEMPNVLKEPSRRRNTSTYIQGIILSHPIAYDSRLLRKQSWQPDTSMDLLTARGADTRS